MNDSIIDQLKTGALTTRLLHPHQEIPYTLLLLADETREAIDKYIHHSELFVLEKGSEIVAIYALYPIDNQKIEIKNIAVAESLQGNGLGTYLLTDAVTKAKQKGIKSVLIGTGDASTQQLSLYKKNGFEEYEVRKDFFLLNYPSPLFENGVQLKDMIVLKKDI